MPLNVWNGSSWVTSSAVKVWNGSSWGTVKNGTVWNGSSWVEFYTAYAAQLVDHTYTRTVSPASFQVNSNGYIYGSVGATQLLQDYQWLTGIGTGSDYQVYATYLYGTGAPSGSALNTWLTLSSSAQWNVTSVSGNKYAVIDVSIREVIAPNTVLTSNLITIECNRP